MALMVGGEYVFLLYYILRDIFHPIKDLDNINLSEIHYFILTLDQKKYI